MLGPDHELLRSHPIPVWPIHIITLPGDRDIINANIYTSDLVGFPIHVIDNTGEILNSLGYDGHAVRRDISYGGYRQLTPASDNQFWSAHFKKYSIEKWDNNGNKVAEIVRVADWFKPHTTGPTFQPDEPPPPVITGIRQDRVGRLWVLIAVADNNWRSGLKLDRNHPDGPRYVPTDYNEYFDTIIEVLDPVKGLLLARRRVDAYVRSFADDDHLAVYRETSQGIPVVEVLRVQIISSIRRDR